MPPVNVDQAGIIDAGLTALARVIQEIDTILKHRPDPEKHGLIGIMLNEPEIGQALRALCENQALAYDCLFDNAKKRSTESPLMYSLRLERIDLVRQLVGDMDVPQLRNKGVRNALAHFAERLLSDLINYPNSSGMQDLAISHDDAFIIEDGVIRYIRVYVYDKDEKNQP